MSIYINMYIYICTCMQEKQRRATQTQARSWQDRTWLGDGGSSHSSNSQMPPTFVSRFDKCVCCEISTRLIATVKARGKENAS